MSDEEKSAGKGGAATAAASLPPEPPSPDEHTTEPNAPEPSEPAAGRAAPGKWQMPKPKFQRTSGYLPQGYLKDIQPASEAAERFTGSEDTTQEQAPFVPSPPAEDGAAVADVEPQPDLAEQLIPEEPAAQNSGEKGQAKSGPRLSMVVFGVIGIIVFLVAFLLAVYFVFLAKPPGGNNF